MVKRILVFMLSSTLVFSLLSISVSAEMNSAQYDKETNKVEQHEEILNEDQQINTESDSETEPAEDEQSDQEDKEHTDMPAKEENKDKSVTEGDSPAEEMDPMEKMEEQTIDEKDKSDSIKLKSLEKMPDNEVTIGDTKYYLNEQGEIKYAEVYKGGRVDQIKEFFPKTKVDNAAGNVKYTFQLDASGYITEAEELNQQQKIIKHFQYYPKTEYGKHGNNIKYVFDLNSAGYLTKASKREQGTKRIVTWYQYYPKTEYGSHGKNIQYIFNLNDAGYLAKATKRQQGTQRILSWYQYYPNTKYGNHASKIQYIFNLNQGGYLTKATKREQGTKRVLSWYEYYPNTKFGAHANNILYIFNLNNNGYLTKASKREKGTKRILSWYQYYPNTKYGAHGNNIKYIFNLNSSGYLTNATKREKGTKKILASYKYSAKTVYGKHASRISSIILNVPLISQLPELPTGCEITAVTMMLKYKGVKDINKVKLAMEMPYHSWNPNLGYVGNPYLKSGWTIYPPALTGLVRKYAGSAQNLTGTSNANLEKQLLKNKPIVIWGSPIHGFTVHALVLTGFDEKYYYYNDCWSGEKDVKISKAEFNKLWKAQNKRAITY